jgi:fructan beta-fructosidase
MNKKILTATLAVVLSTIVLAASQKANPKITQTQNHPTNQITIKITGKYLNLPVSQQAERGKMTFSAAPENPESTESPNNTERNFVIRLSATPEYWVYADMTAFTGKTLTITYEGSLDASEAQQLLSKIYQADTFVGQSSIYKEENRPQLHFTTKVGWINDPNGLIYYDGEYHLFYQHNLYEREWENMHWGHAISKDLIHWKELPTALYPDSIGTMFSGTAVIDYDNTSGFGTKNNPAMAVFYTADNPDRETQCFAYSTDKGRTFTKYNGNPVIDSKEKWNSHDTRDPKVFWYDLAKTWVLVLNERDGHSIYNSSNLKDWTYQSHIAGFWECPELFELPVDGNPNNKLWVMYGASGTYMLGHFDGKVFTPVTGKLTYCFGAIYAAQTFNNIPAEDGRRIQIGWDRVEHPNMRFKGQMSLPTELTLRTTPDGVRMYSNPVKELDALQKDKVISAQNLTPDRANDLLKNYSNEATLRIKTKVKLSHATFWVLALNGQNLVDYNYNFNFNGMNSYFFSPNDISSMELEADIFIDKTTVQVFLDGGKMSYCLQRETRNNETFRFWSDRDFTVETLEIYSMNSIWQ